MAIRLFQNLALKVVSVILAALLWLIVSGEQTVERVLRIPLEYTNIPAQLALVGEPPPPRARASRPASRQRWSMCACAVRRVPLDVCRLAIWPLCSTCARRVR